MPKNNEIEITKEGLHLLTEMCHYGYFDGFYGKDVYFTDGFNGDRQYLFQALGNIGANATRTLDEIVSIVIIGNSIMDNEENNFYLQFTKTLKHLLNQNNSPYRKLIFITERHLIMKLKRRVEKFNDKEVSLLIEKYKQSIKTNQPDLYEQLESVKPTELELNFTD